MEKMRRTEYGGERGARFPCPPQVCHLPSSSVPSTQKLLNCLVQKFLEPSLQPPSPSWRGAESSHPLIMCLAFPVTSPQPEIIQGSHLSHLISINSGVGTRGLLGITKDIPLTQEIPRVFFRALCQEPETKTNLEFLHHNITPWARHFPSAKGNSWKKNQSQGVSSHYSWQLGD